MRLYRIEDVCVCDGGELFAKCLTRLLYIFIVVFSLFKHTYVVCYTIRNIDYDRLFKYDIVNNFVRDYQILVMMNKRAINTYIIDEMREF